MKRHLFCAARFKDDGLSQRDPSRRRHTAPNRVFDIFSSALSGESSCQQSSQCVCPSSFIRFNKNAPFFFSFIHGRIPNCRWFISLPPLNDFINAPPGRIFRHFSHLMADSLNSSLPAEWWRKDLIQMKWFQRSMGDVSWLWFSYEAEA